MKSISCVLLAVALAACAAPQTGAPVVADGSSPARAVLIDENDTRRGIAAENLWIQAHMPGCRKVGQALLQHEGAVYDRITVHCPEGRREVYFDIGRFFGRLDGRLIDQ